MNAQRILHVINEFDHVGNGIVNVACDLAYAQARVGHAVGVASLDGSYVDLLAPQGVEHFPLELNDRGAGGIYRAQRDLGRILAAFKPEIIHAHTMSAAVLGRLRAGHTPVVCTMHNEYQRFSSLMRVGHVVVGVSEAVSTSLLRRGFPLNKVRTVVNGAIGGVRGQGAAAGSADILTRPAIVTIGMVSERKGSDLLVAAFEELADDHPDVDLYFVGDVHWPELVQKVESGRLKSRIHFLGFSPYPKSYLSENTIFVLPSRHEPFGLVILEARESGAPIIGSSVDGIPEALDYGQAGILFESGSVPSLSRALSQLLNDEESRATLSRKSRIGLERFTVHAMAERYQAAYDEAMVGRGRKQRGKK